MEMYIIENKYVALKLSYKKFYSLQTPVYLIKCSYLKGKPHCFEQLKSLLQHSYTTQATSDRSQQMI